jgi:hypothetical protein
MNYSNVTNYYTIDSLLPVMCSNLRFVEICVCSNFSSEKIQGNLIGKM